MVFRNKEVHLFNSPSFHKVDQLKEAFLIVALLRSKINLLQTKLLIVITKLPIIHKRPRIHPGDRNMIFMDSLENLSQIPEVVLAAWSVV